LLISLNLVVWGWLVGVLLVAVLVHVLVLKAVVVLPKGTLILGRWLSTGLRLLTVVEQRWVALEGLAWSSELRLSSLFLHISSNKEYTHSNQSYKDKDEDEVDTPFREELVVTNKSIISALRSKANALSLSIELNDKVVDERVSEKVIIC
jgi:hypothetical protein